MSGVNRDEQPIFIFIEAKRISRWLFKTLYRVTVYWGMPEEFVKSTIQLCEPAMALPATEKAFHQEPLVVRLSKQFPGKDVVGCKPGQIVGMQVAKDGTIRIDSH